MKTIKKVPEIFPTLTVSLNIVEVCNSDCLIFHGFIEGEI